MRPITSPTSAPSALMTDRSVHRIGLRVPDRGAAAQHLAALTGGQIRYEGAVTMVRADPTVRIELLETTGPTGSAPRVIDLGAHHLCWRVTDIQAAVAHLDDLPDAEVLGDIIEVPDGPIAGNKWIYYRSPWGTLFELQQWPHHPSYTATTDVRLDHTRHTMPAAALPGYAGVDHTGYSVVDLEATIAYLAEAHAGRVALRTELAVGREFMRAQFGIDVEGTSRMAMLTVGGLNVELFEHHIQDKLPPPAPGASGGHHLTPRGVNEDVAPFIVDPPRLDAHTSTPESSNPVKAEPR